MLNLEVVLLYESFEDTSELWELLASNNKSLDDVAVTETRLERTLKFRDVLPLLQQLNPRRFDVDVLGGTITGPADIARFRLTRLDIQRLCSSEGDAENWIGALISDPRFVQARIFNEEYDHWQNAESPLQYRAAGRDLAGVKFKPTGLPFPLDQTEIDTSENPGRWILRQGYIESVGSTMWLAPAFFEATASSPERLIGHDWLQVAKHDAVHIVRAWPTPFTTAVGVEGQVQDRLRAVLYPAE